MGDSNGGEGSGERSALSITDCEIAEEVLADETVFESLSHPHRRYICYALAKNPEWSLVDLATELTALENDVAPETVTDPEKEQMYIELYHSHVPKLVDLGVVAFDEVSERVSAGANADRVLAALKGVSAERSQPSEQREQR
ncbi:DUF7344 domain-containing protein [Candidatus Halobonum tyrrellensis]|uniref:DUF7344 domain-containing protein n=1 Tax=Candidatus Halobonum tyrrellensis G22 TaxID=1324957 RepID=V4HK22_9EURY|nr:hypothetical protein [Candidatus Halobonum tyrrellensis]ESP90133.1 hypothetical protein K933_01192 [Candidatus Halobonum tyrrellensis G22]